MFGFPVEKRVQSEVNPLFYQAGARRDPARRLAVAECRADSAATLPLPVPMLVGFPIALEGNRRNLPASMNDSHQSPEQLARVRIDRLLRDAGWVVQDMADFNRNASEGVAVREFRLPSGPCDYLLFVDGKAAGVVEAKKAGVTLSGVAGQSDRYMATLPDHLARWDDQLRFDYETTGQETFFRDTRDPKARSRRIFSFHRPETLHHWLIQPETL